MQPTIKFKSLHAAAQLPRYATPGAVGMDLSAVFSDGHEFTLLYPGQRKLIRTGLAVEIPLGFEGQIRPRSGLALKNGITVLNSPGTIDADYRGEIGVILLDTRQSGAPFYIRQGDRIAQFVITTVALATVALVDELDETPRGAGGFGSTGLADVRPSGPPLTTKQVDPVGMYQRLVEGSI